MIAFGIIVVLFLIAGPCVLAVWIGSRVPVPSPASAPARDEPHA